MRSPAPAQRAPISLTILALFLNFGNRIIPAGMPGTALGDSSHTQPYSFETTETLYRLEGVLGTGRKEPAIMPQHWGHPSLISANQNGKKTCCGRHETDVPSVSNSGGYPGMAGSIHPARSRTTFRSSKISRAFAVSPACRSDAANRNPGRIHGRRRRKASRKILRPRLRTTAFPCRRPTANPIFVPDNGSRRNNNRTSSPRMRMPVRKTRSNSHVFFSLADRGKQRDKGPTP